MAIKLQEMIHTSRFWWISTLGLGRGR